MTKIGDVISRVRGQVKAEVQDAFVTDRYIYSLLLKFAQLLMRRQDNANKLIKFNSVWETLPLLELIDVDKVEAECSGIRSGVTIKRTKHKLPTFFEGYWGPLIRTISSLDGSIEVQPTYPGTYASMTKSTSFRYNNNKYYWFLNGHIYLPNVEWDAIKLEGVFQEDISTYTCDKSDDCLPRREQPFNVPEFLFAEIEQQVLQVILNTLQIPSEDSDNKLNPHR
jgi:hypothetical protein|tara:strand:- start:3598 stop:4269 length:672 start_codon:yes stop_codon:yes gene_type:complete